MSTKTFSTKTRGTPSKYDPNKHPLDIYLLAREGKANSKIAEAIGISSPVFEVWVTKHEAVRYSLLLARNFLDANGKNAVESFKAYVFKRLPPDLQGYWQQIEMWQDHHNGAERIEALLAPKGTAVRQSLWLHAMIASDFNQPEACRMVNIPYSTLRRWQQEDENFPRVLDHLLWCKKQFFEGALIQLVKNGNTLATIFANRSQNKDLGYSEKIDVNHKHSGNINVNATLRVSYSVDQLALPLEWRRGILDKIRELKRAQPVDEPATVERTATPQLRPGRMALAVLDDEDESED